MDFFAGLLERKESGAIDFGKFLLFAGAGLGLLAVAAAAGALGTRRSTCGLAGSSSRFAMS